jgi:hypothetical protein
VKKRLLVLPCLVVVSAVALAACGGSGGGEEGKIEEAIETAATSTNPSKCTEVETQSFVEQNTQESGSAAVKKCEEEAESEEENAESAAVSNVKIEGESATADAAITGSPFDGQTLEVGLVEEEGKWKVNELAGFAKLDQQKLVESFKKQFSKTGEISEAMSNCIAEALEEASKPELEELILSGSPKGLEAIAKECS